jgi:hypothetical protein
MLRERSAVYEPEELSLLGSIFDQSVAALPAAMRTPANRTEIAKIILRRAAAGELEREALVKFEAAASWSSSDLIFLVLASRDDLCSLQFWTD